MASRSRESWRQNSPALAGCKPIYSGGPTKTACSPGSGRRGERKAKGDAARQFQVSAQTGVLSVAEAEEMTGTHEPLKSGLRYQQSITDRMEASIRLTSLIQFCQQ